MIPVWLSSKMREIAVTIGVFGVALLAIWKMMLQSKKHGRDEVIIENLKEDIDNAKEAQSIRNDVRRDPASATERLRARWTKKSR